MPPTFHRLAATFALLSHLTAPRAHGDTGLPVSAQFGGFQRAASALRGHNTTPLPHTVCPGLHSSTNVLATHSQSDGSVERPYNHGVVPLKNSNRHPNTYQARHPCWKYAVPMPGTMLAPMMRMNQPHVAISEPKAITQHPTRSRTNTTKHHSHHAPCVPCDVCRAMSRAPLCYSYSQPQLSTAHRLITSSPHRLIAPTPKYSNIIAGAASGCGIPVRAMHPFLGIRPFEPVRLHAFCPLHTTYACPASVHAQGKT